MAQETYVIQLDIGLGPNIKRDCLGARPDRDSAAAAIKTWVEQENAELTHIWGVIAASDKLLKQRLFSIAADGLSAKNGFKDTIWARAFGHDAALV